MRGAIVGFGTIAAGHLHGYLDTEGVEITAVVDTSPLRRELARNKFGLSTYSSLGELTQREPIDFIDICTPPNTHLSYAYTGLSNRLHVLCEKPVFPTITGTDFEALRAQIGASSAIFYPSHNYKFAPILSELSQICRSDDFGAITGARFRTLRANHAIGVSEWKPHWRREKHISRGGILNDHGPHSIYLALLLTGEIPIAVSCLAGRLAKNEYKDTEDTALLRMVGNNNVQIDLDVSWAASHRNSYYELTGSTGRVVVENDQMTYWLDGRTGTRTLRSDFDDPSHRDWFRRMIDDFKRVAENPNRQWELTAEAWTTSAAIAAAYRSAAARGEWTTIEQMPSWLSGRLPAGWPTQAALGT